MEQRSLTNDLDRFIHENPPDANNDELSRFIKASEEYENLVSSGRAIKRGFNLLTTEEIYSQSFKFLGIQR